MESELKPDMQMLITPKSQRPALAPKLQTLLSFTIHVVLIISFLTIFNLQGLPFQSL